MQKFSRRLSFATAIVLTLTFPSFLEAQESDLLVTKSGPVESAEDTDVSYSVSVTNLGPDASAAVTLDDPIPAGMSFVSATQDNGPVFVCATPNGGDTVGSINCTAPTLAAGETADFTFVFHIPAGTPPGTPFTNVATASTITDPNSENDSGTATTITPFPPQGDVSVMKEGPSGAGPDTDVVYTIVVNNIGPNNAVNVSLNDVLPGDSTFVSLTQDPGSFFTCSTPAVGAGGTVSCTAQTFPAGTPETFILTVHIPAGTPAGTTYANTATVASDNDPNEENNISSTVLTVSASDVAVVKTGPPTVTAGDDLSYTITVSNNGPDPAFDVMLDDVLPPDTTFVSLTQNTGPAAVCSTPFIGTNGPLSCNFSALADGASAQFTLVLEAGNTSSISNTATVTASGADGNTNNNSSTVVTAVTPSADLTVVKTGPATVTAGSDATYTITVTNEGPSDADSVTLTDTVPANATLVSLTQNSGPAFNCTGNTCTIATLASGATATFTLVMDVDTSAAEGSSADNTATISATGDPNSGNNSSTAPATVTTSADLQVTKTGPATAAADSDVTYTITVTNNGPSDAAGVSLTDTPPANTTFVSMTQTTGPAFVCAGSVTCTIASLAAGASATFDLVLHVSPSAPDGTSIDNTATVSATTTDPAGGNNSSTAPTTVTGVADLAVVKSGPATANADTDVTYTITVTNNGPSAAASVSLTDTPPANTTFVSMTQTTGPAFVCAGTVTCTIASLASGATATFDLVLHVAPSAPNGSSVANTATVSTTTNDPDTTDNSSTANTTVIGVADLAVVKTGPATANADSDVTYTITVTNNGPSSAASVSLSDTPPANTTFVSMTQTSGPAFACAGTVTCTIATLASGATATFDLVLHVAPSTPGGTIIANIATVSTVTSDPNGANNSSTANTTVIAVADLAVTKTGPATANADTDVTYTITVTNNGPSDAASVSLSDTPPPNTSFVSMTQTSGPVFICSGTVTCTIATLAAGVTATFDLVLHVNAATPDGTLIANTATVSSTTTDPNPTNNSSTAATNGTGIADVAVVKTGPPSANVDTDVTYTITVTNNGPSAAANVSLTDTPPSDTTFVSITQMSGPTFACVSSTCTIATLAAGTSATFELVLHVAPGTPNGSNMPNTATVSTTTNDPNSANNSSTATTVATAVADLAVTKTGPSSIGANFDITYVITLTNDGPSDAASVTLTDLLPADTTFVSLTQTGGPTFACATPPPGGTGTVTCTIDPLPANASASFNLVLHVLPQATGTLSNTATATSPTDPGGANNSGTSAAAISPVPVPTLSPMTLALLALMLGVVAVWVQGRM